MSTELINSINKLKKSKNAVILGHTYQCPEIQDIADFVGDSLGLSRQAVATEADIIIFAGVIFMAETAAILNPQKKVYIPDTEAKCPMARQVTPEMIKEIRKKYPGIPVVCYVNTTAEVKAESDICCTSANAVKIISQLKEDTIIFTPDPNLAHFTELQTGKKLIAIPEDGGCWTHHKIMPDDILALKEKHPDAKVMVHPECYPEVCELADIVTSTGGMMNYPENNGDIFIVGTESGILHTLQKKYPNKTFIPVSDDIICPNMKRHTLEKLHDLLRDLPENLHITVDEPVASKARVAIEKMLEMS